MTEPTSNYALVDPQELARLREIERLVRTWLEDWRASKSPSHLYLGGEPEAAYELAAKLGLWTEREATKQ